MSAHQISYEQAKSLVDRYRVRRPVMTTTGYENSLPYSETFDAKEVQRLLDQPGCVSFRIYYGMNEEVAVCLILVGVNDKGEDIIQTPQGNEAVILEYGVLCPPKCNFYSSF
jgi:hypothetical protein